MRRKRLARLGTQTPASNSAAVVVPQSCAAVVNVSGNTKTIFKIMKLQRAGLNNNIINKNKTLMG